jgi:D-amino-acid oxidase
VPRVLVIGAGVIGLTAAVRLREAGIDAHVVAREPPAETTSAVAAAVWYPYLALPRERVTAWSARTYTVLAGLADVARSGVRMRRGTEIAAPDAPEPWWRGAVPDFARTDEGFRFTAPVADMSEHLPWLVDRLGDLGGTLRRAAVGSLEQALAEAPVVVNCAGLGAAELAGDRALRPVRGQVVYVEAPAVAEWLVDDVDGGAPAYVVPRERDVVCGGTAEEGEWDRTPDPATAEAILKRCAARVPALRGARVLGGAAGLRPVRPAVRLEADGPVIHCYGHGGAGVTLGWGCAEEVVELVAARLE